MDCGPPDSFVHGISHARILEWTVIFYSKESSRLRDPTYVSCNGRQILYHWATREAHFHVKICQNELLMVTYPLQYSCLANPMDGGAWWAAVHGVTKSLTWLNDFTFTFHCHALEKEMATHSSVLAWRIPGMGEPGGLPSLGSHRVGYDWSDLAAAAATFPMLVAIHTSAECGPSWGETGWESSEMYHL